MPNYKHYMETGMRGCRLIAYKHDPHRNRDVRAFADAFGVSRLLLACTGMSFTHPVTGERLALDCPLADDFARVVSALGWDAALPAPLVRPSAA